MKQVVQDPKSGRIETAELASPALRGGCLLVRNHFSVVSPGTERDLVSAVRDSYLTTARARPDLVRRVMESVRRDGVVAAYRKVQSKLSEPRALGYASAGVVLAVGEGAGDYFRVGDRVACAGFGHASHAEVVCVPVHLAARIPDAVATEHAAFATLGAIALQGIRQAQPTLGEQFAVVGLGILGQLTTQMLCANGVRVCAFDLAADLVERAKASGAETGVDGDTEAQVATALAWTEGIGVDAVLVTAASKEDGPMVAAAGMSRDRGRVVAVGFVPFALPREIAFAKELDLRISRSYGPGRYDLRFEEKGVDYPIGYVRWTETRNLEAFLRLVADRKVDVASLITDRAPVDEAARLYDRLLSGGASGRPLGVVIEYPTPASPAGSPGRAKRVSATTRVPGQVGVAFIGAGAFARGTLLPKFRGAAHVRMSRVVTAHGLTAEDARARFGFEAAGTEPREIFDDPSTDLVCIATRHDRHAELAAGALRAGKHVFVEKPLALNDAELADVESAADGAAGMLMIGFNRRFSPMAVALRDAMATRGPLLMTYRINAGSIPPNHWVHDPDLGGGRVIGEVCHFVDLLSFLAGDVPIRSLQADSAGRSRGLAEDVAVQIGFADGSVGQILYTSGGNPRLPKERLEMHAGGASAVLDDFRECKLYVGGKSRSLGSAGKGHGEEIDALLAAVRSGGAPPVPAEVYFRVTRATFDIHRALAAGSAAATATAAR
ncbi:MAG TPA: bi-domain-containing oxidoreductase [Candidatus Polarisedimenticolaceae bacterium]